MKRQLIYITALVLLLTACVEDNADGTTTEQTEELPEVEEVGEERIEVVDEKDAVENVKVEIEQPLYELNTATWRLEPIEGANPQVVLLTFDDAPDKHALDMAKTLKELDAPAIFFVNGHFIDSDEKKATLKKIHELGFTIGNHTKTHANLQQLSEKEQADEILDVSDVIEKVIGERPKFFRAPFGQNTDYSKALVEEEGMLLMNWSFGYDWEKQYMDATAIADIMVNTELLQDGANLLMHDREWTSDGLRQIVEGLRARGYDFIDPSTIRGLE